MFWLILQILFFLIFAAGVGAALAWWWFRRRYEDITERYSVLMRNQSNAPASVTKSDLDASLASSLQTLRMPDLVPMEERVAGLERAVNGLTIPDPDLSPIIGQLETIESHLTGSNPDIDALSSNVGSVYERLELLQSQLSAVPANDASGVSDRVQELSKAITDKQWVDLRPLEARMARLEAALQSSETPEADLSSVHSAIADVQLQLEGLRPAEVDLEPIQGQLDHLVQTVADLRHGQSSADGETLDVVTNQLGAISSALATMESPDLESVRERMSGIERLLAELALPDMTPIQEQLQGLHVRLANFEGALNAQAQSAADLEPVQRQMELLASRMMVPDQNFDVVYGRLTSLTETLSSIEAALGSIRAQFGSGQYGSSQGIDTIERRLAVLQDSLVGLRQPDLGPVIGQIRAIEGRLDFGSLESRLTAIEYSLASLHQLVRSRDSIDYGAPVSRQPPANYLPPQPIETRSQYSAPYTPPSSLSAPRARRTEPVPPAGDPIQSERRPDDKANLLVRPAFGTPDDLERISGVGPKLRDMLHGIGVYYFWQVSEWSPEQVEWVDSLLDAFHGRIERDNWVSQARMMAAEPTSVRRPGT
ncbi:MAG: hypothetical protein AAF683_03675 [Pseudomonadota bacterium]